MSNLFRKRRVEHDADRSARQRTADTIMEHRRVLKRVRGQLHQADQTLADEILMLDQLAAEGKGNA